MGGFMQPQGQVQVLLNLVEFGMNVQEAGDAARFYHTNDNEPTGRVMTDGGSLELEGGVCASAVAELVAKGHAIVRKANGGGYQAIERRDLNGGLGGFYYAGASEMRKDGMAAGY
jgi:gamma-glutamyltranspeptidase/glutathione hydrolase